MMKVAEKRQSTPVVIAGVISLTVAVFIVVFLSVPDVIGQQWPQMRQSMQVLTEAPAPILSVAHVAAHPVALATDARTGHVFVLSQGHLDAEGRPDGPGTVTMLDAATGRVLQTTAVGQDPVALAVAPQAQRLFVLNGGHSTVSLGKLNAIGPASVTVLDARSGTVIRTVDPGPLMAGARSLAVSEAMGHVYVAAPAGEIAELDSRTGVLQAEIDVTGNPTDLAVDERASWLFVANGGAWQRHFDTSVDPGNPFGGSMAMLDTKSAKVKTVVALNQHASALAVDSKADRVVVVEFDGSNRVGAIEVVDLIDGTAVSAHTTDLPADSQGIVGVDEGTGHAFVVVTPGGAHAGETGDPITVFTLATKDGAQVGKAYLVSDYWGFRRYVTPAVLSVDPIHGRVYVATGEAIMVPTAGHVQRSGHGDLSVLDAHDGHLRRILTISTQPSAIAVNSSGSRLFVADRGANSVSVIDTTQGL